MRRNQTNKECLRQYAQALKLKEFHIEGIEKIVAKTVATMDGNEIYIERDDVA